MNWEFIKETLPRYVDATILTLELGVIGIILSVVVGLICSNLIFYKVRILKTISKAYIEVSRNTPLLIQLFFLFYGLPKMGIKLSGFTCGVIGLTFLGGSYMAEAIRGGLEAVSKGQIESGLSIGLTRFQTLRYIILPQAISIAIPSIGANCLFLLKETSIVGAIAVADLMFLAKDIIGMEYKTIEALFLLVVFYLIILLPISILISYLEKKGRSAEYGD